jgi:ABC-type sugar transport system substrate-binding protein
MKKSNVVVFFVSLLCILTVVTACSPKASKPAEQPAQTGARAYSSIKIGAIQPGPENYYQTFFDRIEQSAKHAGMSITTLLSEYSSEKELRNVEDLISQGVDCILIFALTSDSAQQIAQVCNAANVPLFLISAETAPGPGKATCLVKNDFFDMGYKDGAWLRDNLTGPANIIEAQGALGTGIGDGISAGFDDAIKSRSDFKVLFRKDCQWDRASAIALVEDQISAGTNFNVVFVHNEDMCGGVVSVLRENNLQDKVTVITQNGSEDGFKMLEAKQIACTVTNSPSLVAGEAIVRVMQYFDGTLKDSVVNAEVFAIDQSNYKYPSTITWNVSWALQLVDDYLASK